MIIPTQLLSPPQMAFSVLVFLLVVDLCTPRSGYLLLTCSKFSWANSHPLNVYRGTKHGDHPTLNDQKPDLTFSGSPWFIFPR